MSLADRQSKKWQIEQRSDVKSQRHGDRIGQHRVPINSGLLDARPRLRIMSKRRIERQFKIECAGAVCAASTTVETRKNQDGGPGQLQPLVSRLIMIT